MAADSPGVRGRGRAQRVGGELKGQEPTGARGTKGGKYVMKHTEHTKSLRRAKTGMEKRHDAPDEWDERP